MRRSTITGLAAAVALSAAATPADARSKRKQQPVPPYPYERSVRGYENPSSHECIRARSLDPGGNYRNYPCWARAALSGNPRR